MPLTSHRLFFALQPDVTIAPGIDSAVAAVRARNIPRAHWVKRDHHHVTLHWLGDFTQLPATLIERAKNVAATVANAPFAFVLDHASSFRGKRQHPCVLLCRPGSDLDLQSFWRDLAAALTAAGLDANLQRRFTPHLTIAYADTSIAEPIAIEPIHWRAQQFVLIDSHVGATHHEVLGTWPLRAPDPEPIAPIEPNPADCCGEGCVHCVLDVYDAARERYEAEHEIWSARHLQGRKSTSDVT